jgi:hypothetical protein
MICRLENAGLGYVLSFSKWYFEITNEFGKWSRCQDAGTAIDHVSLAIHGTPLYLIINDVLIVESLIQKY